MLKNKPIHLFVLFLGLSFLFHGVFIFALRPEVGIKPRYLSICYWGSFLSPPDMGKTQGNNSFSLLHTSYSQRQVRSVLFLPLPSAAESPLAVLEFKNPGVSVRNKIYRRPVSAYHLALPALPKVLQVSAAGNRREFVYALQQDKNGGSQTLLPEAGRFHFMNGKKALKLRALVSPMGKIVFVKFYDYFPSPERDFSVYYWLQNLVFRAKGKREWVKIRVDLNNVQVQY